MGGVRLAGDRPDMSGSTFVNVDELHSFFSECPRTNTAGQGNAGGKLDYDLFGGCNADIGQRIGRKYLSGRAGFKPASTNSVGRDQTSHDKIGNSISTSTQSEPLDFSYRGPETQCTN